MAATFRTRLVQVNQVIFDQIDIFQSDLFNRVTGLTPADVAMTLTFNNTAVTWPLVDGTSVLDTQVASGSVYWNELVSGAYGIRFFPNALGHWNLAITYSLAPQQIIGIDFDVVNMPVSSVNTGLRVDFCT